MTSANARTHGTGVALAGVAAAALLLTLSGCSKGTAEPTPTKVGGTAPSAAATPTATASPDASDVPVPASLDVKRLGPGWATRKVPGATPAGLYVPCGQQVSPKAVKDRRFAYTAPGGYTVVVENAKFTDSAATRRAAMGQALLNCGADDRGGVVTTNAILAALPKLDSLGAHITREKKDTGSHATYFAVAEGNLLVSVLVSAPPADDTELPSGVLDAFGARVATAAVAAATGGSYGPIAAPKATDGVYGQDTPAGVVDGPAPALPDAGEDADTGISGPVQLPGLNEIPEGMDGPRARDGWKDPGDEP